MANSVSYAGNIAVTLLDNQQKPLANAVVYLLPKTASEEPVEKMAIMDQVDTQFYPHILAVQRNTQVSFPNSDSIQHHVYSFSSAKVFELELYKGLRADPLLFDNLGVVEMGCNVHDWMLGYIYVVDTPYFKKSGIAGEVIINVPDGEYTLKAWHPRISDSPESFQMMLSVRGDIQVKMSVPSALLPDVNAFEDSADEFGEYE
ncbi:MAG: methylamine utilization protein [Alteromonadaceae bacterium]|jgi:plastocyanin|nr:methylamine utilization protein [Alteromonadaceae bacterium]